MDFLINDNIYTIELITDELMLSKADGNSNTIAQTNYREQRIFLSSGDKNVFGSLAHELMHVWMWETAHSQERNYDIEEICEISAKSYKFIDNIVEMYRNYLNSHGGNENG